MFKNRNKSSHVSGDSKTSQKVTTQTVETNEGVRTTTTTITATRDDFDSAFKKLNLDPKKFSSGGTSVTRQIIYTNSAGQKEVFEETTETYGKDHVTEHIGRGVIGVTEVPERNKPDRGEPLLENRANTQDKFEEDSLKKHNDYRRRHGVPELALDRKLCSYAKEWADQLASTDRFEHRRERKYGENLYMKWSTDPNHLVKGEEAVESWYSEIKDYIFGQEPRSMDTGHFTQVIWKDNKRVGIAWSRSKSGKILVVANYDPPGNFIGRYRENVPPPKK